MRVLDERPRVLVYRRALAPLIRHHEFLALLMERRNRVNFPVQREPVLSAFVELRLRFYQLHQLQFLLRPYPRQLPNFKMKRAWIVAQKPSVIILIRTAGHRPATAARQQPPTWLHSTQLDHRPTHLDGQRLALASRRDLQRRFGHH